MIDPRVLVVLVVLWLGYMGVVKAVHGAEWLAHKAKSAITHVVHPSKDVQR